MPNNNLPDRGANFSTQRFIQGITSSQPAHISLKDKQAMAKAVDKSLKSKIRHRTITNDEINRAAKDFRRGHEGVTKNDVNFFKGKLKKYTREAEKIEKMNKVVPKWARARRDDDFKIGGMNFAKSVRGGGKVSYQENTGMKFLGDKPVASALSGSKAKASVMQKDGPKKNFRPTEIAGTFGRG